MYKKKRIVLSIFIGFIINLAEAQQDPQYTQYMFNTASINPAYLGSKENLNIMMLHRSQWVGFEGAPITKIIALSAPVDYYRKIGLGFSVVNDVIGITKETYFNIDFSYNIPFGEYSKLSFGLKTVGHYLDVDYQSLSPFHLNDVNFQGQINDKFSPNIGAGVYYNTDKFYVGLSVPNLLETTFFDKTVTDGENVSSSSLIEERMHFYWIGGYVFDINDYMRFKPTILTKLVVGAPLQLDVSGNFLLYNKFSLGLAYRWGVSLSAMVGFRVSKPFMVGFAYDRETTALGNSQFNDGSFEIILRYHLPERCCGYKRGNRRLIPRFF